MNKKRKQDNTHYFNVEMKNERYYRSDTVPNFKVNQVKETLKRNGYIGDIKSIKNTRVDSQNSFKVDVENSEGVVGKFIVNVLANEVTFKGTV